MRSLLFFPPLQMQEVAKIEGIEASQLKTVLEFYHDLGVLIYYGGSGTLDRTLRNTVIVNPQWLVDMIQRLVTQQPHQSSAASYQQFWHRLHTTAILEEQLVDIMWWDVLDQKSALLGLTEKFDLLCERLPSNIVSTEFWIFQQSEVKSLNLIQTIWCCFTISMI